MAKDEVRMPRQPFRIRSDGKIRAEFERILTENGRQAVINGNQYIFFVRGLNKSLNIADIKTWI